MLLHRVSTVLAVALGGFLIFMGIGFMVDPLGNAAGFGLPESSQPGSEAIAFLKVKGGRDIGLGLVVLALLFARQPRATGWALVAMTLMPVIDATIVLTYDGRLVDALTIHVPAAVGVLVTGLVHLRVASQLAPGESTSERTAVGSAA